MESHCISIPLEAVREALVMTKNGLVVSGILTTSVTVEDPPVPFSPFSLADCTMLSHFSFNDFIAVAFPDLAGVLNIQI